MRESERNRLQAPLPARFKVPTLVQPKWRVVDLLHAFRSEETVKALRAEICAHVILHREVPSLLLMEPLRS